jgi:hypothetical protein
MVGQKRKTKDGKIVQIIDYSGSSYTCVDLSSGNSIYITEADFLPVEKKLVKKETSVIVEQKKQEFLQDDYEYQPQKEEVRQEILIDTIEQPKLEIIKEQEVFIEKKKEKIEIQTIIPNSYKDKYKQLEDL